MQKQRLQADQKLSRVQTYLASHYGRDYRVAQHFVREHRAKLILGDRRELVRVGTTPEKGVIGTAFTFWRVRPLACDSRPIQ